jgi:hypothetical protein
MIPPQAPAEASPAGSDTATRSPAHELRRYWLRRAFESAGIDASHWDPAAGVDANRRTIERVYDYYGRVGAYGAFGRQRVGLDGG